MSLYSFDLETHLIQAGLLTPPLVCASYANPEGQSFILAPGDARRFFKTALDNAHSLSGDHFVYDLGVMCADDPENIERVFKALDEDRVYSADVLEALHDNARGCLHVDPSTGAPVYRYSAAVLAQRYLGVDRTEEKKDGWRYKYALLDGVPLDEWPAEAIDYPKRDALFNRQVVEIQLGPNRFNAHCIGHEMRAAWFLQLACIWGMRTCPELTPLVVADIRKKHEESRRTFIDVGLVSVRRCTWKKDKETGERTRETADDISAEYLREAAKRLQASKEPWVPDRLKDLGKALKDVERDEPVRFCGDKKRLADLVTLAYQGDPPQTQGGAKGIPQVSTSRDTLIESGDELLEEFGEAGPNEKLFSTYVDVMEQGLTVPINPEANVFVSSDRTSYRKPNLQQLPRKGQVRETFVPRPGKVYCSVDYAALELAILSQVNLNLFGFSKMADAINADQDLHTRLAARIRGREYAEMLALVKAKDPVAVNLRQLAKPINFGLPGMMGPPKLVATARKDGVRFCELSGLSEECSKNERVTRWGKRQIGPTCCVCLQLAAQYKKLWLEEWPEMADYHELMVRIAEAGDRGDPLESFGNGMLRLEGNPNAVSNHYFQNLAAQGAKRAGAALSKEAYTDRKSCLFNNLRLVVFVHDEVISEIRESVAHECAWRKSQIMVSAMQELVPDVKIKAEPALMRRLFKGADLATDRQGYLKPWWPQGKECTQDKHVAKCACWKFAPDQERMWADISA